MNDKPKISFSKRKNTAPCINCNERCVGCHSSCTKYGEWKKTKVLRSEVESFVLTGWSYLRKQGS